MIPERQAVPQGWRPCANCGAVASIPPGGGPCVICYFPEDEDDGPEVGILVELADRMSLRPLLDQDAPDAAAVVSQDDLARTRGRGR